MAETDFSTNPSLVRAKNYERGVITQPGGDDRDKIVKTWNGGKIHPDLLPNSNTYWQCLVTSTPTHINEYATVALAVADGHKRILINAETITEAGDIAAIAGDNYHISGLGLKNECIWAPEKVTFTGSNCMIDGITIGKDNLAWQLYWDASAVGAINNITIQNCIIIISGDGTNAAGLDVSTSSVKAAIATYGTVVQNLENFKVINCEIYDSATTVGPDNIMFLGGQVNNVTISGNTTDDTNNGTTRILAKLGVVEAVPTFGDDATDKENILIINNISDSTYGTSIEASSNTIQDMAIINNKNIHVINLGGIFGGEIRRIFVQNNLFFGDASESKVQIYDNYLSEDIRILDNIVVCTGAVNIKMLEFIYGTIVIAPTTYDEAATYVDNVYVLRNSVGNSSGTGLFRYVEYYLAGSDNTPIISTITNMYIQDNVGETNDDARILNVYVDTSTGTQSHEIITDNINITGNNLYVNNTAANYFAIFNAGNVLTTAGEMFKNVYINNNSFVGAPAVAIDIRLLYCNLLGSDEGIETYNIQINNNSVDGRTSTPLNFSGLTITQAYAAVTLTSGLNNKVYISGNKVSGNNNTVGDAAETHYLYACNNALLTNDITIIDNSLVDIQCPGYFAFIDNSSVTTGSSYTKDINISNNRSNRLCSDAAGLTFYGVKIDSEKNIYCENVNIDNNSCTIELSGAVGVGNIYTLYHEGGATADAVSVFTNVDVNNNDIKFFGTHAYAASCGFALIDNAIGQITIENMSVNNNKFYGESVILFMLKVEGEQYTAIETTFSEIKSLDIIGNKAEITHGDDHATILKILELIDITGYIGVADKTAYQGNWNISKNAIGGDFHGASEVHMIHFTHNGSQEQVLQCVHLTQNVINISGAPAGSICNGLYLAGTLHDNCEFINIDISNNSIIGASTGYLFYASNVASAITTVLSRITIYQNRATTLTKILNFVATFGAGSVVNNDGTEVNGTGIYYGGNKVSSVIATFTIDTGTCGLVNDLANDA